LSRFERHPQDLDEFIACPFVRVVPVTMAAADRFSRVAAGFGKRGTPIPTNDIWVAAQATETGAGRLSFDRHYEAVDGFAWRRLE
jgi:tRNA(fMet)-specific endonuclease VapC